MSNPQPNCCLKFDFQKVDQRAGGKWLIHDTKRTISCKGWNSPAEYPSWVARCDIKGSVSTVLNPIFSKKVQGQKHPGRWGIVEHQIPSIKMFKTNTKSHKHHSMCQTSWVWGPFLVGGFGRQPLYDEMGAAARNIHCYTVIGFW